MGYSPWVHKESGTAKELNNNKIRSLIPEKGFPGGSDGKESAFKTGDPDSFPRSGRSLGGWHGSPLQYSCLENSMDRGAWQAQWSLKDSDTTELLTLSLSTLKFSSWDFCKDSMSNAPSMKLLSRVQLFATPWTVAHQAPPSMGFSRQE